MCEVVVAAESAFEGGDLGRPDAEVAGGGCDADSSGLAQWSQVVSSGHFGWVGEQSVDLAADRSFEASHGLFGGLSLDSLLGDVGAGAFIAAHANQGDLVDGAVGLAVPAAVEAVSGGFAGARGDRADAA